MSKKNGNFDIKHNVKGSDNIVMTDVTESILKCMAGLSGVSNAFDNEIRASLMNAYGRQIDEIVRGIADVTWKVKEIMSDVIEDNLYDSDFTWI